jgi:hypothetical protein
MSGGDLREADGYRPGEGYRSPDRLSLRGVVTATFYILLWLAAQWLLDTYFERGLVRDLFNLFWSAIGLGVGLWMIFRPERHREIGRRAARILGVLILVFSIVIAARSFKSLFFPE